MKPHFQPNPSSSSAVGLSENNENSVQDPTSSYHEDDNNEEEQTEIENEITEPMEEAQNSDEIETEEDDEIAALEEIDFFTKTEVDYADFKFTDGKVPKNKYENVKLNNKNPMPEGCVQLTYRKFPSLLKF